MLAQIPEELWRMSLAPHLFKLILRSSELALLVTNIAKDDKWALYDSPCLVSICNCGLVLLVFPYSQIPFEMIKSCVHQLGLVVCVQLFEPVAIVLPGTDVGSQRHQSFSLRPWISEVLKCLYSCFKVYFKADLCTPEGQTCLQVSTKGDSLYIFNGLQPL